jgi:hypothetical protein
MGASTIIQAQIDSVRSQAALQQLEQSQNVELKTQYAKSAKDLTDLYDADQKMISDALTAHSPGLVFPDTPPATASEQQKKDFEDLLQKRAQDAASVYGVVEPYTQCDLLLARSAMQKKSDSSDTGLDTAGALRDLAGAAPSDPAYDTDRVELLTQAAATALSAANREIGPHSWDHAYSVSAAFAVDCLKQALSYPPGDPAGVLRESLAWALSQSGRPEEGVDLAHSIESLRGSSPQYRVNFARALSAIGRGDEAIDQIEIAVERFGFKDLVALGSIEGLPKSDPRFRKAVEIKLLCSIPSSDLMSPKSVTLVNESAFALDDMVLEITYPPGKGASHTMQVTVPTLESHDQKEIILDPKFPVIGGDPAKVRARLISSLEGSAPIEMELPPARSQHMNPGLGRNPRLGQPGTLQNRGGRGQ